MKTQILKRIYHTKPQVGSITPAGDGYNYGNFVVKAVGTTQQDMLDREYYEVLLESHQPDPTPIVAEETASQEQMP